MFLFINLRGSNVYTIFESYEQNAWSTFISTILHETGITLGKAPDQASDLYSLFDGSIRPFSILSLPPDKLQSLQSRAQQVKPGEQKKETYTRSLVLAVSRAWTWMIGQKNQAANQALEKTVEYENAVFQLSVFHVNLSWIDNPIVKVTVKLRELITEVKKIDQRRANQTNTHLRSTTICILGAAICAIGVFTPLRWMRTAGIATCLFSLTLYGFNRFSHRSDQESIRKHYENIGHQATIIAYDLSYYDENMKLQTEQQNYTPLYADFVDSNYKPELPSQDTLSKTVYTVGEK